MLIQMVGTTWRRWRDWRWRRAAIRELRALDQRTLKDMSLTRGEIVAAVDGRLYGREPVRPRQLEHARDLRARFVGGLVHRGLAGLARLLRRTIPAALCRKEARHPTRRGLPLDPPAGHTCAQPMKESRHARRSDHAA